MKKIFACFMAVILCFSTAQLQGQSKNISSAKAGTNTYSPSLFYHVGIYRIALGLPGSIVDSLNAKAAIAKNLVSADPSFNIRKYERIVVRNLLSEDEYERLLVLKNRPVASALTNKVWNGMIKQQYVSMGDSTKLYGRINGYLLSALVTREYFIDNPEEQTKNLKELEIQIPGPLYKFYHNGAIKPVTNNPYRADFIW